MAALSQPLVYKKEVVFFCDRRVVGVNPRLGDLDPVKKKSVRLRTCAAELRWHLGGGEGVVEVEVGGGGAPEAGLRFPPVTAGAGLINAESKVRY